MHFSLTKVTATETTSWNLHKQSVQQTVDMIPELFHQERNKTREKWEALTKKAEWQIEKEKANIITDLETYQNQLELEVKTFVEEEHRFETFTTYEEAEKEKIRNEINEVAAEYLKEMLSNQ